MNQPGTVYLVGAGPGDPSLITVRGLQLLARADVVLYDYLVNPAILQHVRPTAETVCLGRHGRATLWSPEAIHERMVSESRRGRTVVRLKSGDPLIFGRAAGELASLSEAGIPFEIVPGITAALAAAAYAGVPLTDRQVASAVALVTGQEMSGKENDAIDYRDLAAFPGTLVVYMGVTTASRWTEQLIAAGMPADRPVALVRRCSWPNQQVIRCRLDEVADRVTPYSKFPPPVIAVVGEVARQAAVWNWFERRPLFGQTVVITRPRDQSLDLQQQLSELGADVLVQPAVRITPADDWNRVDEAIARLNEYDDVVFASANGVDHFLERVESLGRDMRALSGVRLVAVGPGTASALARFHLRADLTPSDAYNAEGLLSVMNDRTAGHRVLLVRGSRGRQTLGDGLRQQGATVDQVVVYRSEDETSVTPEVAEQLAKAVRPWMIVTSSAIATSAVRLLRPIVGDNARWISISPLTSDALRQEGIEPTCESPRATMNDLVATLVAAAAAD